MKSRHLFFTFLYITLTHGEVGSEQVKLAPQRSDDQPLYSPGHNDGLGELAYANSDGTQVVFTNTSHKIDATGWTFTSPLWPSIETTQPQSDSTKWFEMVEPFIYADKSRSVDYSLLLSINSTTLDTLKNHTKPLSVGLSFEYYFNYDPKINKPGIKVEIDRKQFRYLEIDKEQAGARKWLQFDEKISISDSAQIENSDWLKISLVNRQSPSLVAIRKLKVELSSTSSIQTSSTKNPVVPQSTTSQTQPIATTGTVATPSRIQESTKAQPAQSAATPERNPTLPEQTSSTPTRPAARPAARPQSQPRRSKDRSQKRPQQAPVEYDPNISGQQGDEGEEVVDQDYVTTDRPDDTQTPAASSTLLNGRIKPVEPKKSGWWGKKRKRRDVATDTTQAISIILTCYRSDNCDWKAESNEVIQWSLARQPPSTDTVQSGYYYMSSRRNNNSNDPTKLLRISLNRSDSATFNDQKADHCIDLAIYVTEKAYLKLYKLTKSSNDEWNKGNLLMIWAPTMATRQAQTSSNSIAASRISLPNSKLLAMESGQNGWTVEQLCFGDFFVDNEEYNSGKCAFGFEMESNVVRQHKNVLSLDQVATSNSGQNSELETSEISNLDTTSSSFEQVVAVSLLEEYAKNIRLDAPRTWLETWQKDLVQPDGNWTFYPKSDYQINSNNVTLLNLFDDAHYHIESKWINIDQYLDFNATIRLDLDLSSSGFNASMFEANVTQILSEDTTNLDGDEEILNKSLFEIGIVAKLVDSKFDSIYTNRSIIDWSIKKNSSQIDLKIPVTDRILEARHGELKRSNDDNLFKIILEFILDCHSVDQTSLFYKFVQENNINYRVTLANVSLSDRCFPSPCQSGTCRQTGTGYEDWKCDCDERRRGRRCEFGQWCKIDHVAPWIPPPSGTKLTLKPNNPPLSRQPKLADNNIIHISGDEYCKRKLGTGSSCANIDLALNENFYSIDGETFDCSCKDDFYLGDDSKCKQVHLCNSIVCPSLGMICDENKPFNRTQPCHCNEKQDWYPDPADLGNKCIRGQCQDKQRDCGFNAHICLPTSVGEKPICKCGPKFTLKVDDKGIKSCKSTACVLPTLNNCQQICMPDNENLQQPYTCACHPGYNLQKDGHSCEPSRPQASPICRPACDKKTQICTDVGCKCKQGYVGEGEHIIPRIKNNRQQPNTAGQANGNSSIIKYVESVTCLNVCSLSYAENKEQFEMIESVCPLGLCDSDNFKCRCSDPTSSALINTKYEPINSNITVDGEEMLQRTSPLCQLKRVCDINSNNYKICKAKGAICVPDYSKPDMFDCVCPPSTEKKILSQDVDSNFKCEQKCSSKKYDCLRRQAVCKLIDKDQVTCDCAPGLMLDKHDQKCYLAKHSYAFNLIIVNRYYEPESKFHKFDTLNNTESSSNYHETKSLEHVGPVEQADIDQDHQHQILPQYYKTDSMERPLNRSIFISDYNRCNVTQIIPKSVIEDVYEHDMESFLSYIDQCNRDIHQNIKNIRLNSRLNEDLRQALRQHIKDFTVNTSNDSCVELDQDGIYLNCTVYLQSNEPVPISTVEYVFNNCDKHGESDKYCWIKPRLLLKKVTSGQASSNETIFSRNELNFSQIIPCEINNFCGSEAISVRDSNSTSLCSCRCPPGIEVIDVKDLQARPHEDEQSLVSIKEVCAKANLCISNSTLCLPKVGSICRYDVSSGSKCICEFPFYENSLGQCVEGESGRLHVALIIVVIVLGIALIISLAINIEASTRSKRLFGRSKQYPLNDFPISRSTNRSTGVPNPVFTND